MEVAPNEELNLLAFTSLEEKRPRLFVATGTTDPSTDANDIIKLTENTGSSVKNIRWKNGFLHYWKDDAVHKLELSGEGEVLGREEVKEKDYPGTIPTPTPSVGLDNLDPGGGSGGAPDWFDNEELQIGDIEKCETVINIGVEYADMCLNMLSVGPKTFTYSCTGTELPLVGGTIQSLSVSGPFGATEALGIDIWAGMNPDTGCLYWGSESAGICKSNCVGVDASRSTVEQAILDDVVDALAELQLIEKLTGIDGPDWSGNSQTVTNSVGQAFIALLVLIIGIIKAALFGGVGS